MKDLEQKSQEQRAENDRLKKELLKDKPVKIEIKFKEDDEAKNDSNVNDGAKIRALQCSKCLKVFPRIKRLQNHQMKCDGLDKKQCKICLKMFAFKQGKYEHTKYVKCLPPDTC
jgi:hypothetical protein